MDPFEGTAGDTLLAKLAPKRREKVEEKWVELQEDNLAIDRVSATQFCEKVDLLIKWGFPVASKKKARSNFEKIQNLRDMVAHAGNYALNAENGVKTIETARIASTKLAGKNWL